MSDIVIFHLKKLWPYDTENKPSVADKCARCGHTFIAHNLSCMRPCCHCKEFMVNLYEEIKAGRKTSEWRDASEYWSRILAEEPRSSFDYNYDEIHDLISYLKPRQAWFVVGYLKGNLPRLEADITGLIFHRNSDQFEIKFNNVKEKTENRKSLNLSSFF